VAVGVICVKNFIASTKSRVDDNFTMIAVEVKGMDPNYTGKLYAFTELRLRIYWGLKD